MMASRGMAWIAFGFAWILPGLDRGRAEEKDTNQTEAQAADYTLESLWADFDPRREPLEAEVFRSEDEDQGSIRIDWLYFTGQTWEGEKTRVFAYRGAPKTGKNLPGILHIHGGGQTANIDWPRYWARRGYVCVSFDFCGDTNLPNLGPEYRRQHFTKWGKIQANMMQIGGGGQMEPTPRHNPWHNWVRMARRSITLLENHPQVDPRRIGIFGISVGGTMTWMVAGIDPRVKAAVPIYGNGWESYRYPPDGPQDPPDRDKVLWRRLIAPETYAPRITCPILFLSATNDGHGKMDLAEHTLALTRSATKRQLFTAGYDHHLEPAEGRCLALWMDAHLKGEGGPWPEAPKIQAQDAGVPQLLIQPDRPEEVEQVDLYYCLNNRVPMSRFWQVVHEVERREAAWSGPAPFLDPGDVIFAFTTVSYRSGRRVSSSLLEFEAASLPSARPTLKPQLLISEMAGLEDWYFVPAYTDPNQEIGYFQPWSGARGEKGFTLNPRLFGAETMNFHIGTHKIGAPPWSGAGRRSLALDVLTERLPAKLQVKVVENNRQPTFKEYFATPELRPSSEAWTTLELAPEQLVDAQGNKLPGWEKVNFLALVGSSPSGRPPVFKRLRWIIKESAANRKDR